jgi:plastocyanin
VRALALAATLAAPTPGHGGHASPPPADPPAGGAQSFVVGMKDKRFRPGTLDVVAGDRITWDNDDGVAHTVTSAEGGFDSGRMAAGVTFSITPSAQGSIPYHCALHFFMTGRVTVHGLGLDAPGTTAAPAPR